MNGRPGDRREAREESPAIPGADVGVIVVHGIGRQKRDETARRLAQHLGDAPPASLVLPSGRQGFAIDIDEASVIVREATWADRSDLTNPPLVRDSRAVLKQLLRTVVELAGRLTKDLTAPWQVLIGILMVIAIASHLTLFGWVVFFDSLAPGHSPTGTAGPETGVDMGDWGWVAVMGLLMMVGPTGLALISIFSRVRGVVPRSLAVIAGLTLSVFITMAFFVLFTMPLFYLSLFTLVAVAVNTAGKFLLNPPLRWIGQRLLGAPAAVRRVGKGYNILVNAMFVIPVHALLQATKAYVNLFSVFALGGGDDDRAIRREQSKPPRWSRPQAILWVVAVTVAFLILLFLSEMLTYLVWVPLVLEDAFRFFSAGWWVMSVFVVILIAVAYVPLGLLLDVSNYQVSAPEERLSIFDDVIDAAAVDLAAAGCAELHIVAHSLGSALAYDWLWKVEKRDIVHVPVTALHTAGSPLNKFWFVDHTISERARDREPLPGIAKGQWKNYWSWMDPVSGKLRRYPAAEDVRIAHPGWYFVSHTRYWEKDELRRCVRLLVSESALRSSSKGPRR